MAALQVGCSGEPVGQVRQAEQRATGDEKCSARLRQRQTGERNLCVSPGAVRAALGFPILALLIGLFRAQRKRLATCRCMGFGTCTDMVWLSCRLSDRRWLACCETCSANISLASVPGRMKRWNIKWTVCKGTSMKTSSKKAYLSFKISIDRHSASRSVAHWRLEEVGLGEGTTGFLVTASPARRQR